MAEGLSEASANSILSAQFQQQSYVETAIWMQLHLGAPGPDGTDNPCVDTTRMDASACFGTDPAGGEISNDDAIGPWSSSAAAENPTHASMWSLETGGTFIGSGALTGLDGSYEIPVGGFTASYPIAS